MSRFVEMPIPGYAQALCDKAAMFDELVALLPDCEERGCHEKATELRIRTLSGDALPYYYCDEHADGQGFELPYADIIRRIEEEK